MAMMFGFQAQAAAGKPAERSAVAGRRLPEPRTMPRSDARALLVEVIEENRDLIEYLKDR